MRRKQLGIIARRLLIMMECVSRIFADKAGEVQSLVAKLQKTERASEEAVKQCVFVCSNGCCSEPKPCI